MWRSYNEQCWGSAQKRWYSCPQTGKTSPIRRIAVRETNVFWPWMGAQIRHPLKTLNTIVLWCTEDFRGPSIDAERRKSLGQLQTWWVLFTFASRVIRDALLNVLTMHVLFCYPNSRIFKNIINAFWKH